MQTYGVCLRQTTPGGGFGEILLPGEKLNFDSFQILNVFQNKNHGVKYIAV